jgi:hypothetical protein
MRVGRIELWDVLRAGHFVCATEKCLATVPFKAKDSE